MIITDTLNGQTIEDVRRNPDGSVILFCDSGRKITLYVNQGLIVAKPPKLILPDQPEMPILSTARMRLREAFEGMMIKYASYTPGGALNFVCEPVRSNKEMYQKAAGYREIRLTHTNGLIDELPAVSARITLPSLSIFGAFH